MAAVGFYAGLSVRTESEAKRTHKADPVDTIAIILRVICVVSRNFRIVPELVR